MTAAARTPRLRSMREFAEQEIVLPTGPFEGQRFKCDRLPFNRLWFDAIDSGKWRRFAATGPRQSSKTLTGFVTPILYHLFEVGETVICGLPSLDMAADKWNRDLLPAIAASRYRDRLPKAGRGSRGGNITSVEFANGATLRFMTGGGGDKSRAGFTSRVVVITEVDGMDQAGGASREADKITQIEACTDAFGDRARVYMECTVSIEEGRIWQEYTRGTQSRIVIRCQHCRQYVTPEREHLVGWKEADNVMAAGAASHFVCPGCGAVWDEEQRAAANRDCKLVHSGQEVTADGEITGKPPETHTLGFRWTAANNLLVKPAVVGMKEWRAHRATDEDNAEKEMRQYVWTLPCEPDKVDLSRVEAQTIAGRVGSEPKGKAPPGTAFITVGIDLGQHICHWGALAWRPNATPHLLDYGVLEVPSNDLGADRGLLVALREFRDQVLVKGWAGETAAIIPAMTFIDSGWKEEVAFQFCIESGEQFYPSKGIGGTQMYRMKQARLTGSKVVFVGDHYEGVAQPGKTKLLVEINSDFWKTWLHERIQTPIGQPGAFTLFRDGDHFSLSKHLTAETKVEEFVPGKGKIVKWNVKSRNNHYFDALYLSCCAGHAAGARLIADAPKEVVKDAGAKDSAIAGSDWLNRGRSKW